MKRRLCIILALLLACLEVGAQFHTAGDDPGGVKWRSISSDNFRIIYPAGSDSLALRYGMELERWNRPLGGSIGYTPNGAYRRPLPVILHGYTVVANGAVTWAPRRMDLYTIPEANFPEPLPWVTELAVHESRHAAQMQFARGKGFGIFNALVGELFTGAMAALYPGPALLEGDAVTAETALTHAGRGRSADFLEHYRVSFAEGDFRNWYRWRWDSQKLATPDHYRAGYMLVAGARYVYDDPLFTKRYYENIFSSWLPLPFFNLQKTLKQDSGKDLNGTWGEIAAAQAALWAADEAARGPFGPARPLTSPGRRYTETLSPEAAGGDIYAIQKGITFAARLVLLGPDGSTRTVRPFSNRTEQIRYSKGTGRLFWSETVPDLRWSLKSSSQIFYIEPGSRRVRALTREGNLFNPSPAPDGPAVAVTEYPVRGGSAVRILDGRTGETLGRYQAPDNLQVVETAWTEGRIVASAVSDAGFGLYDVADGFRTVLPPEPVKIKQLRSSADGILFVSDANGVNELYRLNPSGTASRLTNHRFGASDFLPDASGDSLTFAALTTAGRLLYREALPAALPFSPAQPASPWPVADRLSQQEAALTPAIPDGAKDLFSAPKPYRKLPHLLKLHSWAPVFIDYDAVATASFESISSSAGLGATAFFQNELGTATAIAGYSASRGIKDGNSVWGHSFHGKLTYTGLYPVIELGAEIGGQNALQHRHLTVIYASSSRSYIEGEETDVPYFKLTSKIYVPLNFSRSGWTRGLVPSVSAQLSNDMVSTAEIFQRVIQIMGDKAGMYRVGAGAKPGPNVPLSRITASLRGYSMLATARSAIYPRWGIGAEAGFSMRPGATDLLAPATYAYMYGYLPGLMDTHGIKLSALHLERLGGRFPDNPISTLPRGMSGTKGLFSYVQNHYGRQTRLTFDYAMPLLPLDWSGLGPVAYVRNFELTAHADACLLGGRGAGALKSPDLMYSAGADLAVRLGNLLWIPYATRVGVSWNYNGTTIGDALSKEDVSISKHHFGLILSVDLP